MNLGTAVISLVLLVIVALIIRSLVKDKHAGKNVGCGSCKTCAHSTSTSSHQTSRNASSSCCSCESLNKMIEEMETSVKDSTDVPPSH